MKEIGCWKKAYENDISCICTEITELVDIPAVIVLSGVVGAGKTTFVKHFIPSGGVVSPSYTIINEVGNVLHADFFRLKDEEELIHLELPLYAEEKDYILVEWGNDYLRYIERELGDEYFYYLLEIEINKSSETHKNSRNYHLKMID